MVRSNQNWTAGATDRGVPLRKFLKQRTAQAASAVNAWLDGGLVLMNGRPERFGSVRLKGGELVELVGAPKGEVLARVPNVKELCEGDFAFENEKMLILLKPAGIPSQKTKDPKRITAEGLVQAYAKGRGMDRPILVHRLDRDTSGLLIFAKNETFATPLMDWFRYRLVQKTYVALCQGMPSLKRGQWCHHLGKGIVQGGRQSQAVVRSGGQRAETDYEVIYGGQGCSLWALHPHTGRTHQLRVQLAHEGYPILGDDLYGLRSQRGTGLPHHLLHAIGLKMPPESGCERRLTAPLPQAFEDGLKARGGWAAFQKWRSNFSS